MMDCREHEILLYEKESLIELLKAEIEILIDAFSHIHVNNGKDDNCKKCGLDLWHKVHVRQQNQR